MSDHRWEAGKCKLPNRCARRYRERDRLTFVHYCMFPEADCPNAPTVSMPAPPNRDSPEQVEAVARLKALIRYLDEALDTCGKYMVLRHGGLNLSWAQRQEDGAKYRAARQAALVALEEMK